jgi:hypothetical protein
VITTGDLRLARNGAAVASERARQWDVARAAAAEAGRDPGALEYTRWGSVGMSADDVAAQAGQGATRLIVNPGSGGLAERGQEMSAFAARLGLNATG